MGVMIAPVLGSGCAPACMNLVPKLFLLLILSTVFIFYYYNVPWLVSINYYTMVFPFLNIR